MSGTPIVYLSKPLATGLLLLSAVISFAQTNVQDRVKQAIDDRVAMPIQGNVSALARSELDRGRVDSGMKFDRVALVFKPSPAQQSALEELLAEQQDRSSPNYHKWLTPEQYGARFGMTRNDLAKVVSWLRSEGFTVNGTSRSHTEVFFSGTAAQIENVFHTEIHHYLVNGKMHVANSSDLWVPVAFADAVLGFHNLNDFSPKPRVRVAPRFTSSVSGKHYLAPDDFGTIYDVKNLYSAGFDGSGEKIAILGQTSIHTADLDAFRSASGLPGRTSANFQQVLAGGSASFNSPGDEVESDLDLEWSQAVARNATIVFVYVGSNTNPNIWNALQYAVDNNVAPVISTSYGFCEQGLGTAFIQTVRGWAQQANAQGQTIVGPAGDSGAADCDVGSTATQGPAVDVPASIPEVTGVGGSTFNADNANPATYWNPTNNSNNGSAIQYIPETAWNDTTASVAAGQGLAASGGGVSSCAVATGASCTGFSKPSWQSGTGVPADGKRDVPDVTLSASPLHDGYLICSQAFYTTQNSSATSCSSGFRDSVQTLAVVGGTSAGAPTFAGILALIDQATGAHGLGPVNPTLYSLASTPGVFQDITTGNNDVPCQSGSTGCPAGGQFGFSAGTGYDQVTGLGSVDANNLLNAWPGFVPGPGFAFSPLPSAISIASAGQPGMTTITVSSSNGFSGTVDLTCSPPVASAKITCSISTSPTTNPTSVTLDNSTTSGTATLTVTTMAAQAMSASVDPSGRFGWLAASGGLLACVFVVNVPSRRRRWTALLGLMLFAFVAAGIGCGGGSSSRSTNPGTPPGNYTVTVTGTSTGSAPRTTSVTVTVH